MSYSAYCKRNKIKLGLSPFRKSEKWHSWRGYIKGENRQYYKYPDTKDGYNFALLEFAKWQDSLKESRPWAIETQHHFRLFRQVEKWFSLHGVHSSIDESVCFWIPKFLNWMDSNLESENPVSPANFWQGAIGTDLSQSDFIIQFWETGVIDSEYITEPETIKAFDERFGSKNYELPEMWLERLRQLNQIPKVSETEPQNFGYWQEKYLNFKSEKASGGHVSGDTVRDAEQKTNQFVAYLGSTKIVSELSDDNWKEYYRWLETEKAHTTGLTKQSYFNAARTFLRWCKRQKECDIRIPDNINDPDLTFEDVIDEDEVVGSELLELWTKDEIQTVLKSSEDHWKAYILLALNCGMLAADLNDLKHSQLSGNRLIHRRKKTRRVKRKKLKTINYKLWDSTVEAIIKVKTDSFQHNELLHTIGGCRILTPKGKGHGTHNNISRNWQSVRVRLGLRKDLTLRKLRNTANQELQQTEYRDLEQLWLGHAHTVAGMFYHVVDGQIYEPLDKATDAIGERIGIT